MKDFLWEPSEVNKSGPQIEAKAIFPRGRGSKELGRKGEHGERKKNW